MTLTEILEKLSNLDNAGDEIVPEDAAQVTGDLADKVDAIRAVYDRLGSESERLRSVAAELTRAAQGVDRNAERLFSYVLFAMRAQGFEKLPGRIFRVQIQKAAPRLEIDRQPSAGDFLSLGENVVNRTVSYAWRTDAIKKQIAEGGTFEHGRLKQGEYLRFYVNKGAQNDAG